MSSIATMRVSRPVLHQLSHRPVDCLCRRLCPRVAVARSSTTIAVTRLVSHIPSVAPSASFFTTATPPPPPPPPPRPSLSARLQLRSRSSTFTPIDPDAITIPAALVQRINNNTTADDTADDTDTADDDDPTTLIDRSTAARRTLFRTMRQLQRMEAAGLSMEYVDAILSSLIAYQPLLPREQLHIAALYVHVGRETDAVVWIGRLLRGGEMTVEWAEMLRQSAERAGLVGLEERMNRIVKTLKAGDSSTTAAATMADETTTAAKG